MRGALAFITLLALASACRDDDAPVVFVTAKLGASELQGQLFALRVAVQSGGKNATRDYAPGTGAPLVFPTTFSFSVDKAFGDLVDVEVQGLDNAGRTVAQGEMNGVALRAGKTVQQMVFLNCVGKCGAPLPDAGAPGDGGPTPDMANCGNGRLDPGETCDVALGAGLPGACPPLDCNDGIACTRDVKMGNACTVECVHQEIVTFAPGDGCCPANGTHLTDEDCSALCGNGAVDAPEVCDTGMSLGQPGACPTATVCNDGNACTKDRLISANTCAARCTRQAIVAAIAGDGCCPANASTESDSDCTVVCGNGVVEAGELCDTGVAQGKAGACPPSCDDKNACTLDVLMGAGCKSRCVHREVNPSGESDGCCPPNTSAAADPDCPNACGNGRIDGKETCDKAIAAGQPGACPTACPVFGCITQSLQGTADACSARCEAAGAVACSMAAADGCCAPGCTNLTDLDCVATCGNGVLDARETCDKGLTSGPGACPTSCVATDACFEPQWDSEGSCLDRCLQRPITAFKSGDGCCPPGGNRSVDGDCASVCGNGIVETNETCDRAIGADQPGACPQTCVAPNACASVRLVGSPDNCQATCVASPVTACASGDGCCPKGCSSNTDNDCPVVCGNGFVEMGEACDKGITAGNPGACASTCAWSESCSSNIATGSVENCSRRCTEVSLRACAGGDGCCPVGCSIRTDADCAPVCGNGIVEDQETCDPPTSCPTSCPADADLCTAATLKGDPARCTARCSQDPVLECGPTADQCCPTGCSSAATDPDCRAPGAAAPLSPL
ncbi:MAG: hypothetical protein SF187_15935 [Deltaproteobacteria bacterium]|nr:hypothetical protein [Deltaproteobacteria bacterium]